MSAASSPEIPASSTLRSADSAAFAAAPGEPIGDPAVFPAGPLARLAVIAGVLVLGSLVPYLHSSWADYRYWDRLDADPLLRAATLTPPSRAEPEGQGPKPNSAEDDLSDGDVAALAGIPAGRAAAGLPGSATEEEEAPLAAEVTSSEALVITDDLLGKQKTWLEGDIRLLTPFAQALTDLALGKRAKVRIGHWGDSHLANDGLTHVARLLLHARFGDGGHGFTLVQGRTEWYAHKGIDRSVSAGWKDYNFLSGNARDGSYGYGGVTVEGGAGEQFSLSVSAKQPASQLHLYYRSLGKGSLTLKVDGKAQDKLEVAEPNGTEAARVWQVPEGKHSTTWRVAGGRMRVHGVAFERERGLVYDSLGEVGARGTRWTQADAEAMRQTMQLRKPDLLILNYGGNERQDNMSEASYVAKMTQVVELFKAGRSDVTCILMAPSDHGSKKGGKIISDPAGIRISGWQKKMAAEVGCLYFDTRAAMGGDGAMGRWVRDGLGWSDYSHFTAQGERAMGQIIYRALLEGLRRWQVEVKGQAVGSASDTPEGVVRPTPVGLGLAARDLSDLENR